MSRAGLRCRRPTRSPRTPVGLSCLAIALLWMFIPNAALPTVLNGSLRSTLYTEESRLGANAWETRVDGLGNPLPSAQLPGLESRTRLLESLRLDAIGLGLPRLSLHTAVTAGNVLTDQSLGETRFRLYRAFVQYQSARGAALRYEGRLGRHWVLAGVGSRPVDGVSARIGRPGVGEATGFLGTLGTDRIASTDKLWSLDSPDDSRAYGGRLRLHREIGPFDPQLAVSYARADRTPHGELVKDEERIGLSGELRLARGATGGWRGLRGLRAYGDYRRDLVFGRNLSATGGLDYSGGPRDLQARVEFQVRRPQFAATSFFSSFRSVPMEEIRGGLGGALGRGLRLDVDGSLVQFSGDEDDTGLGLMLSGYDLTLGYRFHSGWGGDLSGLVLYGHRPIGSRLTVDAAIDHSQYTYGKVDETDPLAEKDESATSGLIALGYRWKPDLTFTGQVEGLANAERSSDVRFLGMIHWRFRTTF